MTSDRCPACGAAVAVGAPWCTLCFADLRPKPEPAPEPVGVAVAEPVHALDIPAQASADHAPTAVLPPHPILDAPAPLSVAAAALAVTDAPVAAAADIRLAPAGWPCTGCGDTVSLDLQACPGCGTGFLAAATADRPRLVLPVVGDLASLSKGERMAVMAAGAFAVTVVLFLLFVVFGLVV